MKSPINPNKSPINPMKTPRNLTKHHVISIQCTTTPQQNARPWPHTILPGGCHPPCLVAEPPIAVWCCSSRWWPSCGWKKGGRWMELSMEVNGGYLNMLKHEIWLQIWGYFLGITVWISNWSCWFNVHAWDIKQTATRWRMVEIVTETIVDKGSKKK